MIASDPRMDEPECEQDESSSRCEDKPSSNSSTSLGPPTIHDFDILKPISRGAFGKVYLCNRKDAPEKKLAVKVMKKSELVQKNMVDHVIAERNALAITKSPFVVGLLYCLQTVNNVFLVMEYMIGGDLKSLLSVYGFLEEEHAVFYLAECVLALQYLHRRGIIHRDIKPDNMLISHTGHLKLTDFGLSSTGMRDKELHVADLVAKTPFPAGSKAHRERLIRTPGQILSLTSHLSFSAAEATADSSLGGSYTTARDSMAASHTSHTCDVSQYTVAAAEQAGHGSHVAECVEGGEGRPRSSLSCHAHAVTTPSAADKAAPLVTASCGMVTPLQSSKVRLTRKNSFSEAMAKHVKETGGNKEADLSRKVLDRRPPHHSGSPEPKLNSSALQSLPNSSFDFGQNKTIEFAQNVSGEQEQEQQDEVFVLEEDKENMCVASSPLKYIPSSPTTRCSPYQPSDTPSPSYQMYSLPNLEHFNEDSRGSMSSSPKSSKAKNFEDNIPISPLKPVEGQDATPVLSPGSRVTSFTAAENMRSLRDTDTTLSPEQLRGDTSRLSWDSDIPPGSRAGDRTQEMEVSGAEERGLRCSEGEEASLSRTPSPGPSLPVPGLHSPEAAELMTPPSFKIPCSQAGASTSINTSTSTSQPLKRKCSDSPGGEQEARTRTHLTADLTDLVLAKKVRLDPDPVARTSVSSSSSGSSEEEGRAGYGFSTPVQQYSTPMSAVPHHMKQFKGMKAVKFVSPAGLTPVQPREAAEFPVTQPPLKMPFSLAELDTSRPLAPAVPATPPQFASTPPGPGAAVFKTPVHPAVCGVSPVRQTPLRTPKSMPRPRRCTSAQPSRILGTPDYLAPELLRGGSHGKAVDWWALGACLYEFMTGIPPFNDETPELVFENILSLNIEWPEGEEALSPAAVSCIMSLLALEPAARADDEVLQRDTELTSRVRWAEILDQAPPFVPQPDSATDTTYFHAKNNIQGLKVSCVDI